MRRFSTLPARNLQGWRRVGLLFPAVLGLLLATPLRATGPEDPLAARIAETLCYPGRVTRLALTDEELATYRDSFTLSGGYRDIQGADARADFTKRGPVAECRRAASEIRPLFYCAKVSLSGNALVKGRARLCF